MRRYSNSPLAKLVRDNSDIRTYAPDTTIVGTNPASLLFIRNKLGNDGMAALTWNDLISI